jgi:NADH-quinone oxidoreductase subunit N
MHMQELINATLANVFQYLIPEIVLVGTACVVFLGGTWRARRDLWSLVALGGLVAAIVALVVGPTTAPATNVVTFASPVIVDSLALLTRLMALSAGIVLVLLGWREVGERQVADSQACLLIIVAGLGVTAAANDLVTLFLALEMISIPSYVLLYLPRHDEASQEAAAKYFLLSIFSSALLLFGFSYLYGLAGTTNIPAILDTLNRSSARDLPALAPVALILILAGLGFRITAVPFHFYAPDVYQGAPTVGAAMLAFIPKAAGFVALLRLLGFVVPANVSLRAGYIGEALSDQVPILLWFLAAITMFVGNLLALVQDNVKRMLAYSSVAHAGYMLMALAVAPFLRLEPGGPDGVASLLFYLVAYGAMTVGAFGVLAYLSTSERPVATVDDFAGLSRTHPGIALLMVVFLFSLIGMPLTTGFTGKFLIFFGALAVPSSEYATLFRVLAVLGVVNAAIASWYYLRVVAVMYLRGALKPLPAKRSWPGLVMLWLCALATVGLSMPPAADWLLQAARSAAGQPPAMTTAPR